MATATESRGGYLERPRSSSLADVVEMILDKGLVIDIYVRVSLVGIEVLTIDARIVIASVDTYLRFAEATNRLDLTQTGGKDLPELFNSMEQGGARSKTSGALQGVKDAITGGDDDDDDRRSRRRRDDDDGDERERQPVRRRGSNG
jgi:hypothetical protein